METYFALLVLCAGNSPVTGEFPSQRPVTRSFDVFFDLGLNKRLSEKSKRWWFETPSCSLWRHRMIQASMSRQDVKRKTHKNKHLMSFFYSVVPYHRFRFHSRTTNLLTTARGSRNCLRVKVHFLMTLWQNITWGSSAETTHCLGQWWARSLKNI